MQVLRGCEQENRMDQTQELKPKSNCDTVIKGNSSFTRFIPATAINANAEKQLTKATAMNSTQHPPLQNTSSRGEKLRDEHVNCIKDILEKTNGWERLAQHTNHGSLIKLYRKTSSPCLALFTKIRVND
jgi:mannosyltransferase OCH1-like enzyme